MEKNNKIILAVLLIIGALFYYYSLRPSGIRQDCAKQAALRTNNPEGFNNIYGQCLKKNGL